MSDPHAITPQKRQDTLGLVLEGVNDIKRQMAVLQSDILTIRERTDSALNLAFRAHEKAKSALWMRQSWGPYAVATLSLAVSCFAVGYVVWR